MKSMKALGVGVVMALAVPTLALAVTYTGSFSGAADHDGAGPGVYSSGTNYTVRMTLDQIQEDPWYPWNAAKEYTVVMNVVVDTYSVFTDGCGAGIDWVQVDFQQATVDIYEDDTTPADYSVPGSFVDGDHILVATINNMQAQRCAMMGSPFNVYGSVDFQGGTGYANLLGCAPGGLEMNDFIDVSIITPPTGYEEIYDAEWKCTETTAVEGETWGGIKGLYR